ncbi:MAG: AAA family ATPase [Anaerolineae bacterium]|nr:AAA family ATPase [Anaerolineae bacterium]
MLHSRDPIEVRFDRYVKALFSLNLPNTWAFPTFFLFFLHPSAEFFVKPTAAEWFLRFVGAGDVYQPVPSGQIYGLIRKNAHALKAALAEFKPRDMIDVQSLIWVAHRESKARIGRLNTKGQIELGVPAADYQSTSREMIIREAQASIMDQTAQPHLSQQAVDEFSRLFRIFTTDFLLKPEGKKHLSTYESNRIQARANFKRVVKAAQAHEDITDLVLNGLLPHSDTEFNRNRGAWISIAPAFTGDLKVKFEAKKWAVANDWPAISKAIFEFVQNAVDAPERLTELCEDFSQSRFSKGFQTGTLTPMLSALDPRSFVLINNKSRKVINYFACTKFSQKLIDYPAINTLAFELFESLKVILNPSRDVSARTADIFDTFCHWLVTIHKYDLSGSVMFHPGEEADKAASDDSTHTPTAHHENAFSFEMLVGDVYAEESEVRRIINALTRKKQIVLYGPPGTGKTFLARKLAAYLTNGDDSRQDLVQFHPAYAYEDFVEGIRPKTSAGQLSYDLVPGRFRQFCDRARQRPDDIFVLIIDEINRANLSRVFGELMYLLEYRDETIKLAHGTPFSIPRNVRIIGTMNTADRSIALVDHALRRRFAFIHLQPNFDLLRRFHAATGYPVEPLITLLQELNADIGDSNYAVGVSFFLVPDLAVYLPDIWRLEIEPYLEEHFFGNTELMRRYRWGAVTSKLA